MSDQEPPREPIVTYASYLKVSELLSLQTPRSSPPEHDETLFIVVHQVYELWFKQLLHECGFLRARLDAQDFSRALGTFRRMLTILKTLVSQVDVLETMTPLEFESFRARLSSASGFQSLQFRLFEVALGRRDARLAQGFAHDPASAATLDAAQAAPSLYDSFLRALARAGVPLPADEIERDVRATRVEDPRVTAALVRVYRERPDLVALCERMVDLDEGVQEWRYRHVKMVERTIGTKRGTGGSAGAEYLRSTLFRPLFPELWALRAEL